MENNLDELKSQEKKLDIKPHILQTEEVPELNINIDEENFNIELDESESENLIKRLFEEKPDKNVSDFKRKALESYKKTKERSEKFKKKIFG
jgi:poly(A) polymerase Pap1